MTPSNRILNSFACLLLCDLAASCSHAAPHTPLDIYDGFEAPQLGNIWSHDRFEVGAVEMETNIVRAGHSAVKVVVHAKDKFEAGTPGTTGSERAELMEAWKLNALENTNYEFSFSMYFPTDFPIVPNRLVIAQWKQACPYGGNCSDDSPVLALRYIADELRVSQDLNKKYISLYREKTDLRGHWNDFKVQVRFATNDTGRIKIWLGDKQLVDFKGVTADNEDAISGYPRPSRFYFKMGLYRNGIPEPWTVYIDEYRKKELPPDAF